MVRRGNCSVAGFCNTNLGEEPMTAANHGEYGTLIVCGDYRGDLEAIAKVLNAFEFDQGDERDQRFVVHDGRIEPDRFCIDAVSAAFPLRWWYTSEDGRRLTANDYLELPDEEKDGSWDSDGDDYENLSLAQLSKASAPLLTRGTLELVSVRAYKTSDIQFQRLAIRSDGWAQRQSRDFESVPRKNWHKRSTATYKPPRATRNKLRTTNMGENTCGRS
jgi:hypothetical protein